MSNASEYFSVDDPVLENDYAKNGDFNIWQEQVSLLLPDGQRHYVADFWASQRISGATTVSRQSFAPGQTDVPDNPIYYINYNKSGTDASANDVLVNIIENVRLLNGKQVNASIWLKANATKTVTAVLRQHFGSGGSATVVGLTTTFDLNTFWQQFSLQGLLPSILGKTIGTDDHLEFAIVEEAGFTAFSLDAAQFRLGQGKVPLNYVYKTFEEELSIAQREYEKSYDLAVFPGAVADGGATTWECAGDVSSTTSFFAYRKRVTPIVLLYNPKTGAVGQTSLTTSNSPKPITVQFVGESSVSVNGTTLTANLEYYYQWTADARIPI